LQTITGAATAAARAQQQKFRQFRKLGKPDPKLLKQRTVASFFFEFLLASCC
jgi:hypothetical protein